nr:hypothetical protein [Tanacetum cinerariifolium]
MTTLKYKDDHNKIAYLGREKGCEYFPDILNYLDQSPLRYALTHDPPVVFDSFVKQFWATAVIRPNEAGPHDLVATIDGREVVVIESFIRTQLQLAYANGIFDMPINDIFEGMRVIGYPTHGTLTFYKTKLSPHLRFLVHTIMHCMSPKSSSWNQFSSSIATALICLSTGRTYNFSRFILEGMIGNVKAPSHKFLMYPQFLQMILAFETAGRTPRPTSAFNRKLFVNMKFRWAQDPVPLTPLMMAIAAGGNAVGDAPAGAAAGGDAPAGAVAGGDAADEANVVANDTAGEFGHVPRPTGYVDPDDIEPIFFGPQPRPMDYVEPDFEVPIFFGPQPRPDNYVEPEEPDVIISMEDDTIHGRFHVESLVRSNDAPKPTADAAGRAEDPSMLTILSDKLDSVESQAKPVSAAPKFTDSTVITTTAMDSVVRVSPFADSAADASPFLSSIAGGPTPGQSICGGRVVFVDTLPDDEIADPRVKVETVSESTSSPPLTLRKHLRERGEAFLCDRPVEDFFSYDSDSGDDDIVLEPAASYVAPDTAGPSIPADKEKAPMPELDIPAEFLAEDAQARKRLEEEQASEQADWLNLMIQVGSDPTLARELLGADFNEDNFILMMNALKEQKKRTLADLRYRALQNKPMKKSEQLIKEYEYICKRLENDRLLSAQHSLFRPKPAITEPFAKQQRVEEPSSQPATVSATSVSATVVSTAPDTSSLGASTFSVESQAKPVSVAPRFTDSTVITTAAMDSAVIRRKVRVSPFADSAADASPFLSSIAGGPSPSNVFDVSAALTISAPRFFVADQIPVGVLFESTSMNLQEFFLDSDEEMPPGMSRVAADPDSDDEVVAEILFRDVDDGLDLWRHVNMLCRSLHADDVEEF